MAAVRSDTSKRLGALLLKGWAMLAENCPSCQVPLMKERHGEERLCVNCDTTFISDGQGLRPTNRVDEVEVTRQAAPQADPQEREQGVQDDEPFNSRADPRLGRFAATSPRAGEVAAAGETSVTCSVQAEGAAVARPTGARAGGQAAKEPADISSAPVANGTDGARGSAAKSTTVRNSSSSASSTIDVADLLSQKMLQGWALLDKYCPRCSTVLVRSKATKRMFCVACDAWVLTEAENQKQQQSDTSQSRDGAAAADVAPGVSGPQQPTASSSVALLAAASVAAPPVPPPPQPIDQHEQQGASPSSRQKDMLHENSAASQLSTLLESTSAQPQQQELSGGPSYKPMFVSGGNSGGGVNVGSHGSSPSLALAGDFAIPRLDALHAGSRNAPAPQQQRTQRVGSSPGAQDGSGTGKYPPGSALLTSIGRVVALKMAEAQGLLERTSAVDTEKARSYVSLISECLDLLAKLHSLQQ